MIQLRSYKEILALLEGAVEDIEKFEKGNKAAGKRLRAIFLQIGKLTKTARQEVQEVINPAE